MVLTRTCNLPWRDDDQLYSVRDQLFKHLRVGEPDERDLACRTIAVWRNRGNLPHLVDATALLIEGLLLDGKNVATDVAMRLLYTSAFCRFVTVLVDDKRVETQGPHRGLRRRKLSMLERAKQLRLPASFVDLRHQATHEDLPTLPILRQAVKQGIDWLWQDFWCRQGLSKRILFKLTDVPLIRLELELYSELPPVGRDPQAGPIIDARATKICVELVKLCKGDENVLAELAMIIIEWGFMIPESDHHELGESVDDAFSLWDPLIRKLCTHQLPFFKALTDQLSVQLALPSGPMDISIDRYREVATMWLEHFFCTKFYAPVVKRAKYDINHILSTCVNCQNFWLVRLARSIMAAPGYEATKKHYRSRVDNAIPHLQAGAPSDFYSTIVTKSRLKGADGQEREVEVIEILDNEDEYPGLWQPANPEIWKAKPMGQV
ncbi:MAG: hypothetical protein Q9195_002419 [Heterodermia aff. obscurata]